MASNPKGSSSRPHRVWRGRKGSESWYFDEVVHDINRVKEDKKSGLNLREIAENRAIERTMDVFVGIMRNLPNYHFTNGKITQIDERSDGSVVVSIEIKGTRRR
tara:strand:+ start:135 stop:446 length:312 start_codon:yes stop_codon:yes gene_type:complete